jgi:sodium-dependent phosphate cotransporter
MNRRLQTTLKVLGVLALLYLFFVSIQLMGDSFKTWKGFSAALIEEAKNPFTALFIGVLATSVIQSSSTTTSMVVGFVASGVLDVGLAVPIIMGANVGTSVTNTLVSLGHIHRRVEFQRAMACATVHDIFNLMSVWILLPFELITRAIFGRGFLQEAATLLANAFAEAGGLKFTSPLKTVTKPVSHFLRDDVLSGFFSSPTAVAVAGLVVSAILLFTALTFIVKLMRSMVLDKVEIFFDRYVGANALVAMTMGLAITVMVQSSSITTSMLVPMAGAGILSLRHAFPITLGANVGTTITAILASMAVGEGEAQTAAVTIAFVHLLFNISGILIIYPLVSIRRIPLAAARRLAAACTRRRWFAPVYVLTVFLLIPGILIGLWRVFS